jgi:hypothetical protein
MFFSYLYNHFILLIKSLIMKKTLLIGLILFLAVSVFAQYFSNIAEIKAVKQEKTLLHPGNTNGEFIIGQKADPMIGSIGTTWYDLQTYTNIMNRIYEYPDGTAGAVWQASGEGANPDRGTGYNYFDGTDWIAQNMHIGDDPRTGWPSYAPWGPNGEIISHYWYPGDGVLGPIKFYRREIKGEGDWIESEVYGPEGLSIVWASMMTSGENNEHIHLLARTYDAPYAGQENAVLYYRSSDGGETWDIQHEIIEGLGIDYFANGANLDYEWAKPNGGTIAFCYGFNDFDGLVFKSSDNGDSWEKIVVFDAAIDPFNIPADSPIIPCGDGTSSIALDSEGMAHITFSKKLMYYEAEAYYWYPTGTEGIIYWNENMAPLDTAILSSYTNDFLIDGGYLAGYMLPDDQGSYDILPDQQAYGNQSMTSFSQLAIDENDHLYLAYASVAPGFDDGTNNYRHILVNTSFNGGDSWNVPVDLNTDLQYIFSECVYPALAPTVGDKVHIIYQEDGTPGIFEWLENHPAQENMITHLEYDKDFFTDINEQAMQEEAILLSEVYPNPANNAAYISIRSSISTDVDIEVRNSVGQLVAQIEYGKISNGASNISLDVADYPVGIYFLTVNANQQSQTRKLIIK